MEYYNLLKLQGSKIRVSSTTKMSEDNQNFRSGCPPDYQMFCEKNILKMIVYRKSLSFYS